MTLAIIPSQITAVGDERYAVPQVNLSELLRIPADEIKDKIEKVGNSAVVRLRGELLPLVDLAEILGIEKKYSDIKTNEKKLCRRRNIADRRSIRHYSEDSEKLKLDEDEFVERMNEDRRSHPQSAVNIAVVSAGAYKYGLIVDALHDSEEIVVKPVGRHLKKCTAYAGATIMGDGKVALILDIANIAQTAGLSSASEMNQKQVRKTKTGEVDKDAAAMITFRNKENEYFAAPLSMVERIERIASRHIEVIGERKVIQYRGGALPLYELSQVADVSPLPEKAHQEIVVFKIKEREVGLMVSAPVDAKEAVLKVDESSLKQPAISGSLIIEGHTTLLVDVFELIKIMNPEWFVEDARIAEEIGQSGGKTLLFAEDSGFFREKVTGFLEEDGFEVIAAEDGLVAWNILNEHKDKIDLVLTDLEMPNLDGFELTKRIKAVPEYAHLDVIALTSLNTQVSMEKGKEAGVDDYEIKLDRQRLVRVIRKRLNIS